MGWWWSSASSETAPTQPSKPAASIPPAPSNPPPPSNPDADFHAAYPHLAPPSSKDSASTASSSASSPPSSTTPTPSSASPPPSSTTSDLDPTLPTTMSCRAAFDSAFYCSSLGGHFNDIYRYGQLRSCSEHWADWRFCMSLKTRTASDKAQLIQERYREKEQRVKKGPSSEDVWEKRGPGEEVRNPFGKAEEEARRVEES